MSFRSPLHQQIHEREAAIVAEREARGVRIGETPEQRYLACRAAVDADRLARWQPQLDALTQSASSELQQWASRMTVLYGPKCRIWRKELAWIPALVVARYGEAEDFWPAQLTDADLLRANQWLNKADAPEGTDYIVVQQRADGTVAKVYQPASGSATRRVVAQALKAVFESED